MKPAISIKNLSKGYRLYSSRRHLLKDVLLGWTGRHYYTEFKALDGVSLEVMPGECVGILGRNGSGKSTLLQIVAGVLWPTGGEVEVNGRLSALLELGVGFEREFTGRENVEMTGAILGLSRRELAGRLEEIFDFAGIGEFVDRPLRTYSSGMVLRLAFAVNACIRPEILIVDEALAVGDAAFQAKCYSYLRELLSNGTTVLFVSHDLSRVRGVCDRAMWLNAGKALITGNAVDVAREYHKFCYMQAGLPGESFDVREKINGPTEITRLCEAENNDELYQRLFTGSQFFCDAMRNASVGNGDVCLKNIILVNSKNKISNTFDYNENVEMYILLEIYKQVNADFIICAEVKTVDGERAFAVSNYDNIGKLGGIPGDLYVLSMGFSLPLTHGAYYCDIAIKTGIDGSLFSEDGVFDSLRQVTWHFIKKAAYIEIIPAEIAFGDTVHFMKEVHVEKLEMYGKAGDNV